MDKIKPILILLIILILFGIVGRCDYENAIMEHELKNELIEKQLDSAKN